MLSIMKFLKRVLDIFISLVLLVILSPLLLLVAITIKLDSQGPVIFSQERLGLGGKVYLIYKFRSMTVNAEEEGTGLYSFADDPRVTHTGKWLRMLSLDELPQLINIIKGDMSLVGPRPPVKYELGDYADFDDNLKSRFHMQPGVTGLAQVSGRNDLNWDEKIVFDLEYIEKFKKYGIFLDFYILIRTFWVVVTMKNIIEKRNEN